MKVTSSLECSETLAQTVPCARAPGFARKRNAFDEWCAASLIRNQAFEALAPQVQEELRRIEEPDELAARLAEHEALTEYQARRMRDGKLFGLVLGNYRVLEALNKGGMGIVYKAEHLRLPRVVAVKVLSLHPDQDSNQLKRFFAEMWTIAQLHHPNIVSAIDAGEVSSPDPALPDLHYFVTEYIAGRDLEDHVKAHGPLAVAEACDLIHQVASALAAAHKQNLVHRDVKPSNIMVTPEKQAKLLDFGLARQFGSRLTQPGALLGTLDYMSPEQAHDASSVDIRADIYGLGGTLFWALTGRTPFPSKGRGIDTILNRLTQAPPSPRVWRPDIPADLDALLLRMTAPAPDQRPATPEAVMRALVPFIKSKGADRSPPEISADRLDVVEMGSAQSADSAHPHR